jgi:hypothetical protein
MGGKENTQKGKQWVERAALLRKQIVADKQLGVDDLHTKDFDDLVCFWSI